MKAKLAVVLAVVLIASGCASNSDETGEDPGNAPPGTQNPGTSPTNISENATVVTYTSSGFQPQTVTVEQGDTVVWRSESSKPMWVASNQHPIHSQYAGSSRGEHCSNGDQNTAAFDQCSTGSSFSFTFEKTGEWGYHNHEYSQHSGTVVVE